jgi:hypothetical protein
MKASSPITGRDYFILNEQGTSLAKDQVLFLTLLLNSG